MKTSKSMRTLECLWHQFQRSLRFQTIVAMSLTVALVSQSAIAQTVPGNGIRFPANPVAANSVDGSGCGDGQEEWGLSSASRYGGVGTKASPYKYVLHDEQPATDADGGVHFPRWCGDLIAEGQTNAGLNPTGSTYTLVRETSSGVFASISDAAGLQAQIALVGEITATETADIAFGEPPNDPDDNLVASSASITGNTVVTDDDDDLPISLPLIMEYNPPGAEKKFFYAVLEIRKPPPVSPTIVTTEGPTITTAGANPAIVADSSIGFRVTWDNHDDAKDGTDDEGFNIVCIIENGSRRCEDGEGEIVVIPDVNTVETSPRSKTIIVGSGGFRKVAGAGLRVVVGYHPGETKPTEYTDENTGWSTPVPITFPASIDLGNISVGAGDARTLQLFPATGEDMPTAPVKNMALKASDAVFYRRTSTETGWGTPNVSGGRLSLGGAGGHWRWSATSTNRSVVTARMNADTDNFITDDSVIITGVYGGERAQAEAFIRVVGEHYIDDPATTTVDDDYIKSGDRLEEVIKVTVLKNRAPIFTVTDASVSWPEHAAQDYSIKLMNTFVASGFVSDEDAQQDLIFNFLDADGNVIEASGNEMTSKSNTGFQIQSTGTDAGKITAQFVGTRSQVSFERYANGEVLLTVQASDGHGGTDVLDLTIQVTDENDKPYATTTKFSHAALVDNTGARTANVNLTPHFIDEDGDRLCYRIKPDTMSQNFGRYATVSLAGAATCHLPRLTLTMKSALTQGTPGVGNPIAGITGVIDISVAVEVFELVQADPTNREYSDAKTLTFKLVYGANLAPVIWGGRVTDTTNHPYLSRHTIKEHTRFSMIFSAQDVQPTGDELCFSLTGPDASRFKLPTNVCPSRGANDTFKISVTSTEERCPNPKRPECFMDHESTGGSANFNLVARDLSGGTHTLPFRLILEDVEESPYLAVPIEEQFAVVGDSPLVIDLSEHFRDDDADDRNLAYTVNSSSRYVTASRQGSVLTLRVSSADIASAVRSLVDVRATDSDGNSAFTEFNVKLRNENAAPVFDNGITAVTYSVDENSVKGTVIGAGETATDPDEGDNVTYSFLGGGGGLFKVNANNGEIMVDGPIDFESAPRGGHQFTVAATDDYGSAGYLEVNIVVRDVNEPPMFVAGSGEIPDVTILEGLRTTPCIMASDYFTDPDTRDQGAGLLVTAHSSRRNIATVSVVNNEEICITGVDPGTGPSTVTVTAEDRGGLSIKKRFTVTVAQNLPPTLSRDIPDQSVQESGESLDIDLNQFFDDGDARAGHAERITYTLTISDVTVATATIVHGSMLRIYGDSVGTSVVTVTATDQAGGTATARFSIRVERNEPPTVGQVADVTHRLGLGAATVDISNAFRDDGDTFKIIASTADPNIATASVVNGDDGFQLRIHAYSAGSTTATLTAIDSGGNEVSTKLLITIEARNDPPRLGQAIADASLRADAQLDISLADAFIDEDNLTYTVEVEDDAYADIFVRDGVIRVYGIEPGTTQVAITATDTLGQMVSMEFELTVLVSNTAPMVNRSLSDVSMFVGDAAVQVSLAGLFSDEQDSVLTYDASSDDETIATVALATTASGERTVRVVGVGGGSVTITVTATDSSGASASTQFIARVTMNYAPVVNVPVADINLFTGNDPVVVDISDAFSDADGETLAVTVSTDTSGVATVEIVNNGAALRVRPVGGGSVTITVTATDRSGTSVSTQFLAQVTENEAPVVSTQLADLSLYTGTSPISVDVSSIFSDADGETLSLAVSTDSEDVASVELIDNDTALRINPLGGGSVTITLTATDRSGTSVSAQFTTVVTVNHAPVVNMPLADMSLYTGTDAVVVDISDTFSDADEETLMLAVSTDSDDVASVELVDDGSALQVSAIDGGKVVVTVTATDRAQMMASDTFTITVTVNHPPVLANAIEDISLYTGTDAIMVDISRTFSDPDGETLALTLSTDNNTVANVELVDNDTALRVSAVDGGEVVVTLVATDRAMKTASDSFMVAVTVNHPPVLANAIADMSFYVDDDPLMVAISNTFSDPDDEVLMLTVASHDESIATAMVMMNADGSTDLKITPHNGGEVGFTLTATDRAGKTVSDSFMVEVKVNTAPAVVRELADATLTLGTPMSVRIDDVFEDPDAEDDVLMLAATSSDTDVATVSISEGMLMITGVAHGSANVTVTATDHRNASASDVFGLTVKTTPTLTGAARDVLFNLQIGADTLAVMVGEYFHDADGDVLTYSYKLTGDAITYEGTAEGTLSVTPHRKGEAAIETTATDPGGRNVAFNINVNVSDSNMKAAAEVGLAGYGRTVISSVSSAIGTRVESNRSDAGIAVTKYVPVKKRPAPVATSPTPQRQPPREAIEMPTPQPRVATPTPQPQAREQPRTQSSKSGVSWNTLGNGSNRRGNNTGANRFNMSSLVPKNFSQNLNGDGGVGSWSIWGTADTQNFEGTGYDGSATNAYLGVDVKTMNSLLLGAAVSRNSGSFDYSSGNAEQEMDVEVTSVLPYFAYEPSRKSLVWGVIGGGRGTAKTTVLNSEAESSDLSLFTGVVGGRMTVAQQGSLQLGVRGDFAFADMSTDNGTGAADELSAAVNRTRIGVEASFTQAFSGGGALTPYGEVSVRNDGGDGVTGTGVEIAGGFRFGSEKLRVELNGRTLAMHSEDDVKESGISLMAVLNSSALGTGLSFSLTPSWGSSSQSSQAIWAERSTLSAGRLGQGVSGLDGRAVEARLGYGIPVLDDRYLLTPYLDYRTDDTEFQTMSIGASLTQLIYDTSELDMTFEFGRLDDGVERPSNQIGLTAEMSF